MAFYRKASTCVRLEGGFNKSFAVGVGVRHGCVMSPGLFNIFMDGHMRRMRPKKGNAGATLRLIGEGWSVVACLNVDDTIVYRECKETSKWIDFKVCLRRKLRVNVGKSMAMVFERK